MLTLMKDESMKSMVNISKSLTHGDDLIIRKADFDALRRRFRELIDAFHKIKRGEKELKNGKTKRVYSLAEIR